MWIEEVQAMLTSFSISSRIDVINLQCNSQHEKQTASEQHVTIQ
jgi:hypothetical protein